MLSNTVSRATWLKSFYCYKSRNASRLMQRTIYVHCLSNALHSSIGQNIKSLACPDTEVRWQQLRLINWWQTTTRIAIAGPIGAPIWVEKYSHHRFSGVRRKIYMKCLWLTTCSKNVKFVAIRCVLIQALNTRQTNFQPSPGLRRGAYDAAHTP